MCACAAQGEGGASGQGAGDSGGHLLHPAYTAVRAVVDIIQWREPLLTILAAMLMLFLVNGWGTSGSSRRSCCCSSPPSSSSTASPTSPPRRPPAPPRPSRPALSGPPAARRCRRRRRHCNHGHQHPHHSQPRRGRGGGGGAMRMLVVEMEPTPTAMASLLMVKDGIAAALTVFQRVNVALLKVRSIFQSAEPQLSRKVCSLLLVGAAACAVVPLLVPARVIGTVVVLHVFSAYFNFQKQKGGPQTGVGGPQAAALVAAGARARRQGGAQGLCRRRSGSRAHLARR
ncbi:hypothetical protein CLOM_g11158 [Closterium sp. NIES-68]|nr:hypothetical protein CLOM_g11158 [Closterium sp. NIES-68]